MAGQIRRGCQSREKFPFASLLFYTPVMLLAALAACAVPLPDARAGALLQPDATALLVDSLAAEVRALTQRVNLNESQPLRVELQAKVEALAAPFLAKAREEEAATVSSRESSTTVLQAQSTGDQIDGGMTRLGLEAWLDKQLWRTFRGKAGRRVNPVNVQYVTVPGSGTGGGLIVVPGNSEASDKYAELLYRWSQEFSPVIAIDHRGQGRSPRLLQGEPFKNHVDDKDDFIDDLRTLVATVGSELPAKRYLACHSMGCAISFSYLIKEYEAGRPNVFSAVAANAPLLQANTAPFPYFVAQLIGAAQVSLGIGHLYPPTSAPAALRVTRPCLPTVYPPPVKRLPPRDVHHRSNSHANDRSPSSRLSLAAAALTAAAPLSLLHACPTLDPRLPLASPRRGLRVRGVL